MLEKNCSCQNSTLKVNDLYSVYSSTLYTYSARLSSFVWGGDFMDPLMSSCQQQREGSALLCFILDVLKKEKNIHHGGPPNTALWWTIWLK